MTAVAYGTAFPSARPLFNRPTPSNLFASGDTGDWWDASDFTTMFQDSAGTTPVTAAGQVVGRFVGKKNGIALTQGTSNSKPVLTNSGSLWWLNFDGVDDFLKVLFTMTQPTSDVMAVQQISWASPHELWDGNANTAAVIQSGTSPAIAMFAGTAVVPTSSALLVGEDHVVTSQWNGASSKLAVDNGSYATGNSGTSAPSGLTIAGFIDGINNRNFTNMRFYGGIRIGRILSDAEIALCRNYFGAKAGVTL